MRYIIRKTIKLRIGTSFGTKSTGDRWRNCEKKIRFFLHAFRYPILEEIETGKGRTLVPIDSEFRINDGRYIELVDLGCEASKYVDRLLGSHPLVNKNSVLRGLYIEFWLALDMLTEEAVLLEYGNDRAKPTRQNNVRQLELPF